MGKCRIRSKNGNCLARTKLYVGEEYLDEWPGVEQENHLFPFFHDLQMARKEKKKSCNSSNIHGYLISIAVFLQKVEAAAVWDVIQDFIQLPASQHPYSVDWAWCSCVFLTSREISLFFLWNLHPTKTVPGDISMNNTFYWLIHIKNWKILSWSLLLNNCFVNVQMYLGKFYSWDYANIKPGLVG